MSDARLVVLDHLDQLEDVLLEGSRIPFSGGRLVNESDAVEVLDAIRETLPKEVERAAQLLERRDEFLNTAKQQADDAKNREELAQGELVNADLLNNEARDELLDAEQNAEKLLDEKNKAQQQADDAKQREKALRLNKEQAEQDARDAKQKVDEARKSFHEVNIPKS